MYGPHYEPPPIEKIRKAQWTVENTRETMSVVSQLVAHRFAMLMLYGEKKTPLLLALEAAIRRFKQLDPGVEIPSEIEVNR